MTLPDQMTDPGPCQHGDCGATPARQYINSVACAAHSPAGRRGGTVPVPDPDATLIGMRRQWYADRGLPYQPPTGPPETTTLLDQRRIASGKVRSSIEAFRAAQAATGRRDAP